MEWNEMKCDETNSIKYHSSNFSFINNPITFLSQPISLPVPHFPYFYLVVVSCL